MTSLDPVAAFILKRGWCEFPPTAVCCLSPRQLFADFCLFSTERMIDNVRIREVYHSYAALHYLPTDNVLTSKNPAFDSTERHN